VNHHALAKRKAKHGALAATGAPAKGKSDMRARLAKKASVGKRPPRSRARQRRARVARRPR
jgi:hypothetical protein